MLSPGLRVALILSLLALSPALGAESKPDIAIKNKAIDGRVSLSADIKSDPALAANCLAEGRKWIERQAAEAAQERKESPEAFRMGPWDYSRDYSQRSVVAERYVSVLRNDDFYTGGAHPNRTVDTILWDRTEKKRISIRPFFTETADNGPALTAMRKAIIVSLTAAKQKRGAGDSATDEWFKDLQPKLLKIGAVTLAPSTVAGKSSGLSFHYPPYAVGAYAEGDYIAYVPWEVLKPYLSPEGQAIFAGQRPKEDEAEDN